VAELPLTGSCLCGGVRFELLEPPSVVGYCHCTRCQKRTGTSSSIAALANGAAVRITAGEQLVRGWTPPGDGMEKCFCVECGGHLFSRSADGSRVGIRMAAFDVDPGLRPSYRQYVANAAAWEPIPDDGLPRFDGARPGTFPAR
jgi:hypothetical protein